MRALLAITFLTAAIAFCPTVPEKTTFQLAAVNRREVIAGLTILASPQISHADGTRTKGSTFFFDENIEKVREESQLATGGKIDLNNAAVVSALEAARASSDVPADLTCLPPCFSLSGTCRGTHSRANTSPFPACIRMQPE